MVITAGEVEDHDYRHQNNHRPTTTFTDRENLMAGMVPERSRGSFSNFSSLPCFNVKWGRQRYLRCVKYSDHDFAASSSSPFYRRPSPTDFYSDRKRRSTDGGGFDAMREKLMLDFREEAHQIQADFLRKSDIISTVPSPPPESRPWNLRTRRAVCKEPNSLPGAIDRKPNISPAKQLEVKSPGKKDCGIVDGGDGDGDGDGGKGPRPKFSVSLSKHEIEEDFVAIMGIRPARRPKKRPKNVQRQIDGLFPGFWLTEITADLYKVNEQP